MKYLAIAAILLTAGCSVAIDTRYPWDHQPDRHVTVPPRPTPTPAATPEAKPARLEFEISPLDIPDIKIAYARIK